MKGYKKGEKVVNILCYADDLQRLLRQFNDTDKTFNMVKQNE